MPSDLTLGDDRIGTLDIEALRALVDGGNDSTATPPVVFPGDPINPLDHGFDPDEDCLADFIARLAHKERTFVLPRGTYRWERPLFFTGGDGAYDLEIPERFALVGQPQATIEVDIDSDDPMKRTLFRFGGRNAPVPHVELHDFHVDVGDGDPARDAGICRATVRDRMDVSGLSMTKRCRLNADGSRNGDRFTYKVDVTSQDGVATHRDIDLTAGDTHRADAAAVGHAIPFASEPTHEGLNRWLGCRVAGYTDNGFYVRNYSETGRNVMEGCLARNCGGGNIRIGRNDQVRSCHIVVDGSEQPADGCGLWVENAKATTVDGLTIDAPAMDNDMVRFTGSISGASIRDIDATLGDTGEYALKARGGYPGGHVTCAGWTVRDACTGRTRLASYSIDQPNVTFRNLTHHGTGGRIPFETREEGFKVENATATLDDTFLARLGHKGGVSRVVDAIFDDVTVIDQGGQNQAFAIYSDPDLRRFAMRDCDLSRASYGRLFQDTKLDDFSVGYARDVVGW